MKVRDSKKELTVQSIIATVLIVLFIAGIITTYYAMLYSETRQNIIKDGELSSVTSADSIDKYLTKGIETIKLTCFALDNLLMSGKSQDEVHEFLVNQSAAVINTTENRSTGLYGYINGEYLDGTEWRPDADYVPTERPWYIDARAHSGSVAVVDPYIDAQTGNMMITFSKTLCDGKSVAAMDFSIDFLQEVATEVSENREAFTEIVLDRKYNVIAHSVKGESGKNYIEENNTLGSKIVEKLRSTGEGLFTLRFNNSEYIVYSVYVSNDWICLSVYNATTVFRGLRESLLFTVIVLITVITILLVIMIQSRRKKDQFTRLSIHVVEALAAAIDAKDTYTKGHSGRVAEYAREIGRRYGFAEKQLDEIYMMGLLHDVGKIGIPDAVINKPGKLTEEEYEIIKTHPAIGADILEKTKEMPRMAIGARWHHERYDGKGYPDGLSGQNIPTEARIIAIADAYDAMTSRRSYRDILPQDAVRREIEKGKNTQFDAAFADVMIGMIDEDKGYTMRDK